jgi:hypothetical protein
VTAIFEYGTGISMQARLCGGSEFPEGIRERGKTSGTTCESKPVGAAVLNHPTV